MYPGETGNRQLAMAMMSALDDSVGATVQALKDNGMYDNSVIIFMSDVSYINVICIVN